MLSLNSISKSYGKREILRDISHDFAPGLNLLVGPSGAGKSTLLRLCATVEKPSSGTLMWHGKPYARVKRKLRAQMGYAPQIVDLPLDVTGLEFLTHVAALKGVRKGAKTQARELLHQLGLSADADQRIIAWSGGMRRRLIFAQALLGNPSLLALDEPTAELDNETAGRVAALITHAAQSATVLLTTHLTDHFQTEGAVTLRVADGALKAL
ncbi:MAG: ATP-binding cassette domain-containing protein [Pseudomonadota bacterium]